MLRLCFILASICAISAVVLPRDLTTKGVHLAVSPNCGSLSGSPADVNAGLRPLSSYKTIVAFGDSYTDGGVHNGSALQPAVIVPPNPEAGGRISNGPVWVENLASDNGVNLKDYAVNGAVIDVGQWPTANLASVPSFVSQVSEFTTQVNQLDSDTTLYTIFFGMGDFAVSEAMNEPDLTNIASDLIYTLLVLASYPTSAKNILVLDNYGRGTATPAGDAYKQGVFTGLNALHSKYGVNVGFVDFKTIWDGVLGSSPGYSAFGYTSPGACITNITTTVGACSSPDTTFYWMPGNPSKVTHRIMADYVEEVLTECQTS